MIKGKNLNNFPSFDNRLMSTFHNTNSKFYLNTIPNNFILVKVEDNEESYLRPKKINLIKLLKYKLKKRLKENPKLKENMKGIHH